MSDWQSSPRFCPECKTYHTACDICPEPYEPYRPETRQFTQFDEDGIADARDVEAERYKARKEMEGEE